MSVDWIAVTAVAALLAAVGSFITAYMAKRQVDAGMKPMLALSGAEAIPIYEGELYPIFLFFTNYGEGAANILAVDLDKEIKAHIGTPINIGSEGEARIKIWLPTSNDEYAIRLSLYYWDIQGVCYRTEIQVHLTFEIIATGGVMLKWRIDRDRMKKIGAKTRPTTPLHWEFGIRTDVFHEPWWLDKEETNPEDYSISPA